MTTALFKTHDIRPNLAGRTVYVGCCSPRLPAEQAEREGRLRFGVFTREVLIDSFPNYAEAVNLAASIRADVHAIALGWGFAECYLCSP